jgi:hypothetical protein
MVRATGSLAAALLEAEPDVASYDLEERTVDGQPELIVRMALRDGTDPAEVVARLDPRLHATQYVVLDGAERVGVPAVR